MYSPFGIEDVFGIPEDEYKVQLPEPKIPARTGSDLADAYTIVQALYPDFVEALASDRLHAVVQMPGEKMNIPMPGFGGMVRFKDGDKRELTLQRYKFELNFGYTSEPDNAPLAAAILMEEGEGQFLFLGVNICAEVEAVDPADQVFVEDLREYVVRGGSLVEGRTLSGDERNAIAAGVALTVIRFTLSTHR